MQRTVETSSPASKALRLLILEDSAADAELIVQELLRFGYEFHWSRVDTEDDFRSQIGAALDLVIAEYTLAHFDAPRALAILRQRGLPTPFIIVTGTITEETAVAALKQGADDFLLKDRLARLGPAVRSALQQRRLRDERMRAQLALTEREARLQLAQQIGAIGDWEFDVESRLCSWSAQMFRLFERDPSGTAPSLDTILAYYSPESAQLTLECARRVMGTGGRIELEQCVRLPSGRTAYHSSILLGSKDAHGRVAKLYGTCQDITERKRLEEERAADALRLAELSRRVVAVQEQERQQLARELHERTSPNLTAVAVNLGMISADLAPEVSAELNSRLEDTRALLADAMVDIRDICAALRPVTLDYAGLARALEGYADLFSRRNAIAVDVSCADPDRRLAPDAESALFRICQEALTNCVKHANASAIKIELELGGERTTLTISDDGAGFDVAALGRSGDRPGLGLLTMRERAEVIGGTFRLDSGPGRGTRVQVII